METKPTFKYNGYGVKSSSDMFRNIKGVHYVQWTSDASAFDEERAKAKQQGLRTRIINGELFIEKKHD